MKTTYILILLALTIQVMVTGQTQDNPTRKIRIELEPVPQPKDKQQGRVEAANIQLEKNLQETEKLKNEQQKLKNEVRPTRQLVLRQIEISGLKSKLIYERYSVNVLTIEDLSKNTSLKKTTLEKTEVLTGEARNALRIAKEIREEASGQFNPEAQLAEMSNAEEKEALALAKQEEAIALLSRNNSLFSKENTTEFNPTASVASSYSNANPKATDVTYNKLEELTKQLANIKNTIDQLQATASTKNGYEKSILEEEAGLMQKEYIAAQIEISSLNYKKTSQTFYSNRIIIEQLMAQVDSRQAEKAIQFNKEAEYLFKIAKEIRAEANAQPTDQARLGGLGNAEEKELMALNKQQETVKELKRINKNTSY